MNAFLGNARPALRYGKGTASKDSDDLGEGLVAKALREHPMPEV